MIPGDEIARLHACVLEAWGLARQGRVADGYQVLDLGLTWAEAPALNPRTGEQSPPEPWAAELISLYRHEIVRFVAEHPGVRSGCARVRCNTWVLRQEASELRNTAGWLCERSARLRERVTKLLGEAGSRREGDGPR